MKIRGIAVDHVTIQRWVFKFAPLIESQIKKRKNRVVELVINLTGFSNLWQRQNHLIIQEHNKL